MSEKQEHRPVHRAFTVLFVLLITFVPVGVAYSAMQYSLVVPTSGTITSSGGNGNGGTITSVSTDFEDGDATAGGKIWVETTPPPSYIDPSSPNYISGLIWGEVDITTSQAHSQQYSVKMFSQNGGPEGRCRLNVNLEATKTIYMRIWFRIESWDGYIQLMRFWSEHPDDRREFLNIDPQTGEKPGDYVATVQVYPGGQVKLRIGKHSNGGAQGGQIEINGNYNFQLNRWYCAEFGYYITPSSDGFARVWMDDQLVVQYNGVTDKSDWCNWVTQVRTGVVLYQDRDGISPATIYVDDYAIENTRIGMS